MIKFGLLGRGRVAKRHPDLLGDAHIAGLVSSPSAIRSRDNTFSAAPMLASSSVSSPGAWTSDIAVLRQRFRFPLSCYGFLTFLWLPDVRRRRSHHHGAFVDHQHISDDVGELEAQRFSPCCAVKDEAVDRAMCWKM